MPPKHRKAVTLDDVNIDFSAVSKPRETGDAAELLREEAGSGVSSPTAGQQDSLLRAYDPALSAYAQRRVGLGVGSSVGGGVGGRRRRAAFGGPSQHLADLQQQQQLQVQLQEDRKLGRSTTAAAAKDGAPPPSPQEGAAAAPASIDFAALRAQQASAATSFLATSQLTAAVGSLGAQAKADAGSTARALAERRKAYVASLQQFCQGGLPWASAATEQQPPQASPQASTADPTPTSFPRNPALGQSNSLLYELFAEGVPDVEPWDRWAFHVPRYDPNALVVKPNAPLAASRDVCELVQHPVLPVTDYTLKYQHAAALAPVEATLYKTKDELKAERRERLKRKQEEKRKAAAAAAKESGLSIADADDGSGGLVVSRNAATLVHDRLSNRNLVHNLLSSSVLNPVAAESAVLDQYEQRFLEHQRRNHDRHVAALPNQIAKRDEKAERHATEHPVLRAYRISPIYGQAHLGKLRNFANDNRLRGFVMWVGECDAVVVLAGGEVAARHLDRWILHKMEWESPETRAVRLCSVPLQDAKSFSFHLKRLRPPGSGSEEGEDAGARRRKRGRDGEGTMAGEDEENDDGREAVFMKHCGTVREAEAFLRELPVDSPWENLAAVWRAAFLADGLSASDSLS